MVLPASPEVWAMASCNLVNSVMTSRGEHIRFQIATKSDGTDPPELASPFDSEDPFGERPSPLFVRGPSSADFSGAGGPSSQCLRITATSWPGFMNTPPVNWGHRDLVITRVF